MSTGRWVLLIVGVFLGMVGLGLSVGGGVLVLSQWTAADDDGFFEGPALEATSDGYAVTAEGVTMTADARRGDWVPFAGAFTGRLTVRSFDDAAIFVGVGREDDVDRYLEGVPHSEVVRIGPGAETSYAQQRGEAQPAPPAEQDFWVAAEQGTGDQTLQWDARSGRWAVVVMQADASPGVDVTVVPAARSSLLLPLGIVLAIIGIVFVVGGVVSIVVAASGTRRRADPATQAPERPLQLQ